MEDVLETVETPETEQPVEPTTEPVEPETPETEPQEGAQEAEKLDGRRGPANIRDAIRSISESSPDHAQTLKDMGNAYFREQAYREHFASPDEAASAKQLIESVGGLDGVAKLQERSQLYDQQDEFLREGNPEILDDFAADFPEGFAALAAPYLERLSQANPQAFQDAVAPFAVGMLENAGFGSFLRGLKQESDPDRRAQMADQLVQWYEQQMSGLQSKGSAPKNSAAEEKLRKEQDALYQERENLFNENVQSRVTSAVTPEIDKAVAQYAKQYKLGDSQTKHFRAELERRLVDQMNGDQTYVTQVNLRRSSQNRSHDAIANYIAGEFKRRLKDAAFETAKEIYGAAPRVAAPAAATPKAATGAPVPQAPVRVTQRPSDAEIDWDHPQAELNVIKGQAFLRDGRFVRWR